MTSYLTRSTRNLSIWALKRSSMKNARRNFVLLSSGRRRQCRRLSMCASRGIRCLTEPRSSRTACLPRHLLERRTRAPTAVYSRNDVVVGPLGKGPNSSSGILSDSFSMMIFEGFYCRVRVISPDVFRGCTLRPRCLSSRGSHSAEPLPPQNCDPAVEPLSLMLVSG